MKLKDLGVLPEWDSPATERLGQDERNRLIYELEEVNISEALHKAGWFNLAEIELIRQANNAVENKISLCNQMKKLGYVKLDKDKRICENCPLFKGRNKYCLLGMSISDTDMRICDKFGITKIEARAYIENHNLWDIVKKYWEDEGNYIKLSDIEIDKGKLQAFETKWYLDNTEGKENLSARIINNIQSLIKEKA